jgi:hypothetical protein
MQLIDEIMSSASGASDAVELRADDAFKRFYQAAEDLNRGLVELDQHNETEARRRLLNGYDALRTCADKVKELVPQQLQGTIAFLMVRAGAEAGDSWSANVVRNDAPPTTGE